MYFDSDRVVFLDVNCLPAEEARATLYNQTMHYGYGVFDGMRSYKNADGCNIFKAREHFDRLIKSAAALDLSITYSAAELVQMAYQLLEKNRLQTAYIRPLVFMGPNMELNLESTIHVFIAAWPWKKYLGYKPLDVMVSEYKKPFKQHKNLNSKIVGNYTNSILASNQAKKLGYDEALMMDIGGFVAEGPASNFFIEKDHVLFTPKTTHALAGITRKTIIELATEFGGEVVEKDLSLDEVYQADYAFFTGTATEVTPIRSINGETYQTKWQESQAYSLYQIYRQQVVNDEFLGLTIV
jgi:branched-chain amino acid aminotransferase